MDDELFESWKEGIKQAMIEEIRRAKNILEKTIDRTMEIHGNIQVSEFKDLLIEDLDNMINEVIETFGAVEVERDKPS